MLSIGKLTGGARSAAYYEQSVASGREDYYAGRGEAQGRWVGTGAVALGLSGEVQPGQLERLLVAGEDPATGLELRAAGRRGRPATVQGFDLTFSAPKSVSVLYAAGDERVRRAVVCAHEAAVRDALAYMERQAVQVRRGANGVLVEHASAGLIAGAYRHRTSRAGDPQLHTHVVAANLARGADGRWTALHAAPLYAHAKTGGYLYQASLRDQLTRELSVEWTPVRNGAAEIAGIAPSVLEHFSQRRREILDAMAERGTHSAGGARAAALDTRRAKDYRVRESTIYERWRARAAEHGMDTERLAAVLGREVDRRVDADAAAAFMTGAAGLTAHASTFTRREGIQAWCEHHQHGAPVASIEALTDRWLSSPLAVQVDGELSVAPQDVTATRPGATVASVEARYSTPDMLATENALVERAELGRNAGSGVASEAAVAAALAQRPTIRDEQAAMVHQLTRSGDRIDAVRGLAGTGKTFALDAAADAWRNSGLPVAGVALSGKAADVLRDETGMHTCTIAQLLTDDERLGGQALAHGQVLIVDEAGMVGTRTMARLAEMVERVDGKLVLVGDDHQLSEIDAGGAFRRLVELQQGVELTHVTRQRDDRTIAELRAVREGRADDALRSMQERGNLILGSTAEEARDLMVRDWLKGHAAATADGPAFMVAKRNDDVRDLNQRARQALLERGDLGDDVLELGGREYRVGERVITGRNDRSIGVRNGTTGTVTEIDLPARRLHLRTDRGHDLAIPFDYAAQRTPSGRPQLDYAYAITVHRAQGDTWGRAYYLGGEDSYRQETYTALSRPRHAARFFATIPDVQDQLVLGGDPSKDLAPLIRALQRDQRQTMAIEALDTGTLHATPDERLQAEAQVLRNLTGERPAVALVALDRIDVELDHARGALDAAERRVEDRRTAQERRSWRDRSSGEPAVAEAQHALADARERVATLASQRAGIIQRAGDPAPWLLAHRDDVQRLHAIETELARRQGLRARLAVRAVTIDPPAHITNAIGERPCDPAGAAVWDQAAHHIERYRQGHGKDLSGHTTGLGSPPHEPDARRAWYFHHRGVERCLRELRERDARDVSLTPER